MAVPEDFFDCIIIGAGYSGLAAAKHIVDNEPSRRLLVLEARDRVGGKTKTISLGDGRYFDAGGMFLGADHHMMNALAKEHGVETYPVPTKGKLVLGINGEGRRYSGLIPPTGLKNVAKAAVLLAQLERKVAKIDPKAPWSHPKAAKWDKITMHEWMNKKSSSQVVKSSFQLGFDAIIGRSWDDYSLLFALFIFKSCGTLNKALSSTGGLQQDLMRGGGMGLAVKMYERLREKMPIKLQEPVKVIDYSEEGVVRVTTSQGVYRGRKVIFAVPPHLVANIEFTPALPPQKMQLAKALKGGRVLKVYTTYATPFWRQQGLRGEGTSIGGAVGVIFDTGPPEDGHKGSIVTFLAGDATEAWLAAPEEEKRRLLLPELGLLLGKQAMEPEEFLWDDSLLKEEWSAGCPFASPAPGAFSELGEWYRKQIGPIHWAAAETSQRHCGYMEGAVTAGRRAADEVMAGWKGEQMVNGSK